MSTALLSSPSPQPEGSPAPAPSQPPAGPLAGRRRPHPGSLWASALIVACLALGLTALGLAALGPRAPRIDSGAVTGDSVLAPSGAEIPDGAVHGTLANGRRGHSLGSTGYLPAGGGAWSTPEDMSRYAQAVLTDSVPGGQSPQQSQWDAGGGVGAPLELARVGRTWFTDELEGRTIIGHNGGTTENRTHLAIDEEAGRAVMVFADESADNTATIVAARLLTGTQGRPSARLPMMPALLPALAIEGAFTILTLVGGLILALLADRAPSRLAVVCRTAGLAGCVAAAAASGPWTTIPGWSLAVAAVPGLYAVVRGLERWPSLPGLPRRRAWLAWTHVGLTLLWVVLCAIIAWPTA